MKLENATPDTVFLGICAWEQTLELPSLAHCEVYHVLEGARHWLRADAHPERLQRNSEGGWSLPFTLFLPVVGEVGGFTLEARPLDGAQGCEWELRIPENSLWERPEFVRFMRIDLLPDFAASPPHSEGYLFLPCYTGAIHRFNKTVAREARITVFAAQEQWPLNAHTACFGALTSAGAWCAVFDAGDSEAEVVARSHWGEAQTYSLHPGFVYRHGTQDARLAGDRSVRYRFFAPQEQGDWCAFARYYRDFLRAHRGLKTWAQKERDGLRSVRSLTSGLVMKIFQGHKDISLDGTGAYRSATSFREAREILEQVLSDGITDITVQMVGWNFEGHDGRYPQRFPVNEAEGGEEDFRALIAWGRQHGLTVSVHDNAYDAYPDADNFSPDDLIVLRGGEVWTNVPWAGGLSHKICPRRAMRTLVPHYRRMRELGIDGHYYLDAFGAFHPCHAEAHPVSRAEYLGSVRDILSYTRETFGSLALEVPLAPYLDLADCVYLNGPAHVPAAVEFQKNWVDQLVPFLPIVLHNGIRYHRLHGDLAEAKSSRALMDLALGAAPFVEVCAHPIPGPHRMPRYEDERAYVREAWRLFCQEHADRATVDIESIIEPVDGLMVTCYADGLATVINTTGQPLWWRGQYFPPHHIQVDDARDVCGAELAEGAEALGRKVRERMLDEVDALITMGRRAADRERVRYFRPDTSSVAAYEADLPPYREALARQLGWPLVTFEPDEASHESALTGELSLRGTDGLGCIYQLRVRGTVGAGGESVRLETGGLLFLPGRMRADAPASGDSDASRVPLVFALHGGLGSPELAAALTDKGSCNYNGMITELRENGVAVFAPQLLVWHQGQEPQFDQCAMDRDLRQLGGSRAALDLLMLRWSLDWIPGQVSGIDPERVGVVGLSYGGFYSLLFTALDPRVRAAVSSCFVNDRYFLKREDTVWTGVARRFLDAEIARLICPRAFFIEVGQHDRVFEPSRYPRVAEEIADTYAALGLRENFHSRVHGGAHEYSPDGAATAFILAALEAGSRGGGARNPEVTGVGGQPCG